MPGPDPVLGFQCVYYCCCWCLPPRPEYRAERERERELPWKCEKAAPTPATTSVRVAARARHDNCRQHQRHDPTMTTTGLIDFNVFVSEARAAVVAYADSDCKRKLIKTRKKNQRMLHSSTTDRKIPFSLFKVSLINMPKTKSSNCCVYCPIELQFGFEVDN